MVLSIFLVVGSSASGNKPWLTHWETFRANVIIVKWPKYELLREIRIRVMFTKLFNLSEL